MCLTINAGTNLTVSLQFWFSSLVQVGTFFLTFSSISFSFFVFLNRSPERVESRGSWKSQTTYFGVKLPGISSIGSQKRSLARFAGSRSAPPGGATKTSSQHAIRRHMQNEYKKDVLNSAAVNGGTPEDVTSWYVV